jgi:hypothetical protein
MKLSIQTEIHVPHRTSLSRHTVQYLSGLLDVAQQVIDNVPSKHSRDHLAGQLIARVHHIMKGRVFNVTDKRELALLDAPLLNLTKYNLTSFVNILDGILDRLEAYV